MSRVGTDFERAGRTSMKRPLIRFTLAGVVAVAVLALGAVWVSGRAGDAGAINDARTRTALLALIVVQPMLTDELAEGNAAALERIDTTVRERVLGDDLVRVKIWRPVEAASPAAQIVYSDEPRLIGGIYDLGDDQFESIDTNLAAAEVSDLAGPENRFERDFGKLLEVYLPVATPSGERLLFEAYYKYDSVVTRSREIWVLFVPVMIASLLVLELVQVPLAWSMARELQARQRDREGLLHHALASSDNERRRIARDLHDGIVQDLTALSFDLAAAAEGSTLAEEGRSTTIRRAAQEARRTIRSLRSLLVDIYPPNLHELGVASAIEDLLEPLRTRGIDPQVEIEGDHLLSEDDEALIFRVTQEALRNIAAHADARHVTVQLQATDHLIQLTIEDDGNGFDVEDRTRGADGHLGLRLLGDLVSEHGGVLSLDSTPGHGTVLRLEVGS